MPPFGAKCNFYYFLNKSVAARCITLFTYYMIELNKPLL